ncbi:MAG: hypothetical protein IT342_27585 [Candidatus Melainabacteria bacterium]|nr:hypothetical protein [Candidatus Melainabacteria bacterium]
MFYARCASAQTISDVIPGKVGEGSAIVFDNANDAGVLNGPPVRAFRFEVSRKSNLNYIQTYHWNLAKGTTASGIVGIRDMRTGKKSTWGSKGFPGQGGVPNAYWKAEPPGVLLDPGIYEIVDSDPRTWANNEESASRGIAWVQITPVEFSSTDVTAPASANKSNIGSNRPTQKTPVTPPPATRTPFNFIPDYHPVHINALFENRDNQPVHLWSHGEGISPYNRVEVRATRRRPDLQTQSDNAVTFWAGRNGRELATRKWSGKPPVAEGGWLRVIWDGKRLDFVANPLGATASGESSTSGPRRSNSPEDKRNPQKPLEHTETSSHTESTSQAGLPVPTSSISSGTGSIAGAESVQPSAGSGSSNTGAHGVLTARDGDHALKMDVQLIPENKVLDIDGSGKVDSADARLILRKVVGK